MERNIYIMKYVLEEIERLQKDNEPILIQFDETDSYSIESLKYHLNLLFDGGLVSGKNNYGIGDNENVSFVNFITNKGHDFLDSLRNQKAIDMAEKEANKCGSNLSDLPIDVAKSLLITALNKMFYLE
ncbi:DUF2513 domain-containing protein [Staphylococcus equorum]|uniref:DUF2513 domain-containing protein n=1 Tax=Staphylococcus equorum TaxID=246432 RepID=UPI0025520EB1|nr:DUF2513 domain-containing protein [Staphylococcus equorum]MDK9856127.1 DUF2513 domain-containing protein [Staphylococcus equorum]MDN6291006.1 DUF2513 domain-containing protein [Tetragenococcus koreensis]